MSKIDNIGYYSLFVKSSSKTKYKCTFCKQTFYLHRGEWLYQHEGKNFCSYNCRSKYKAQKQGKIKRSE